MANRSNDDRIIPPDKLELTAAEAAIARRIVDAAPDPAPRAPGILERARGLFRRRSAGVSAQWPPDDKALDYHHFSPSPPPAASTFKLTPDDIEFVLTANRFQPHGKFRGQDSGPDEVIALAIRGLSLGKREELGQIHEAENAKEIEVTDIRPDHHEFKCVAGFYIRTADPTARRITLYRGSTVPNAYLMRAYRDKVLDDPHRDPLGPEEKCNMLPTGCYVCRIGDHHQHEIKPALRMSDPNNLAEDATCTVVRTFNDLMFGTDDFWHLCQPYDNVHCSYQVTTVPLWEAPFSSEGCITVRGKPAPTHQWAKYQRMLDKVGDGRRCDLVLVTGRDLAAAASLRGTSTTPTKVPNLSACVPARRARR
jgi:hypothetical protein